MHTHRSSYTSSAQQYRVGVVEGAKALKSEPRKKKQMNEGGKERISFLQKRSSFVHFEGGENIHGTFYFINSSLTQCFFARLASFMCNDTHQGVWMLSTGNIFVRQQLQLDADGPAAAATAKEQEKEPEKRSSFKSKRERERRNLFTFFMWFNSDHNGISSVTTLNHHRTSPERPSVVEAYYSSRSVFFFGHRFSVLGLFLSLLVVVFVVLYTLFDEIFSYFSSQEEILSRYIFSHDFEFELIFNRYLLLFAHSSSLGCLSVCAWCVLDWEEELSSDHSSQQSSDDDE